MGQMGSEPAWRRLRSIAGGLPPTGAIFLYDTAGNTVATSAASPPPAFNAADRDYFKTFPAEREELYVGAALAGRTVHGVFFPVARAVQNAAGQIIAVVQVGVDPGPFGEGVPVSYRGDALTYALYRLADGALIARRPMTPQALGTTVAGAPFLDAVRERETAGWTGWAEGLAGSRLTAARRVGDLPVVATASLEAGTVEGDPRRRLLAWLAALALVGGLQVLLIRRLRQAEEQTRQSRTALDTLSQRLEFALTAVNAEAWEWEIDEERRLSPASAPGEAGLDGAGEAPAIPAWMTRRVHPEDRERCTRGVQAAIDGGARSFDIEYRIPDPENGMRWMASRGQVKRDGEGRPSGLAGLDLDITERKTAEEAVRDRELQLRLALQASLAIVFEWDVRNDRVRRIVSNDEALPETSGFGTFDDVVRVVHPEDRDGFRSAVSAALRSDDGLYRSEHRIVGPGGKVRWLAESGRVDFEESGEPIRLLGISHDITERKEAEERLRASELRYRTLVDATSAVTWSCPPSGRHVAPQPAWMAFTGQTAEEMLGDGWTSVVHPEDRAAAADPWNDAVARGQPFASEHRIRRRDGVWRWMSVHAVPVRDEDGQLVEWIGMNIDITERKEAEAALRESEARCRILYQTMRDAFVRVTTDGRIIEYNAEFAQMLGYAPEELRELTYQDLTPAQWHPYEEAIVREQIIPRGYSELYEKEYRRKNGTVFPVQLRTILARDASGEPSTMWAIMRDISERKRAEEALRTAHDTFRSLVEDSPFGIYIVDADFRLVQVSRGAQKVFENVRPLIGRDFAEVLHIVWPEPFATEATGRFRHTLATGEAYHSSSTVEQRADIGATEAYDWKIERIILADGRPGVVCHFYDLSERKRYEEHVHLLMREVNHRAKNLLGVVQAIANSTRASSHADFMDRFTARLRALAANQDVLVRTRWRGASMPDLVGAQIAPFFDLVGRRITVSGPPVSITAEAAQPIAMALHELATNATKYGALSNEVGTVAISWELESDGSGEKPQFRLSWTERGGPPVSPPERQGFGTRVIKAMPALQLGGEAVFDYAPTGLRWNLRCPADGMLVTLGEEHEWTEPAVSPV